MSRYDDIRAYMAQNIGDPQNVADAMVKYEVSSQELSDATGYTPAQISDYFSGVGISTPTVGTQAAPQPAAPQPAAPQPAAPQPAAPQGGLSQVTAQQEPSRAYATNPATYDGKLHPQSIAAGYGNFDVIASAGHMAVVKDEKGNPVLLAVDKNGIPMGGQTGLTAPGVAGTITRYGIHQSPTWKQDLVSLANQLDAQNVRYMPGELYGNGSNLGVDLRELAAGKLGSTYNWTIDPLANQKGPYALDSLADSQIAAQLLGLEGASSSLIGKDDLRWINQSFGNGPGGIRVWDPAELGIDRELYSEVGSGSNATPEQVSKHITYNLGENPDWVQYQWSRDNTYPSGGSNLTGYTQPAYTQPTHTQPAYTPPTNFWASTRPSTPQVGGLGQVLQSTGQASQPADSVGVTTPVQNTLYDYHKRLAQGG